MADNESKPGLLILDMSNDDWDGIHHNKDDILQNCQQLGKSDFFSVRIESKQAVPKLKALAKGPKLLESLQKIKHLQHCPKKTESALQGTTVLETLQKSGITHVVVCGTGTDSAIFATAKDLNALGFHFFIVMDATASKNGADAHEKALETIASQFGADVVVATDDLLGDEDVALDETTTISISPAQQGITEAKKVAPAPAKAVAEPPQKPLSEMTEAERAEEMRRRDAEKLAARKKKFDAARFEHIEKANAKAQEQEGVFKKRIEEKRIPGAKYNPKPMATPAEVNENEQTKDTRKGWKLIYQKKEPPVVKVEPSKPLPPLAGKNERPTNVRQEVNPGWASTTKQNERPHTYVHSSDLQCKGLAHSAPSPVNPTGQKFIPHDEPTYKNVGYGTQGDKPKMEGVSVLSKISGLQGNGPKASLQGPRSMAKAKVTESKSESFDSNGNMIRTITRKITEPNGKTRTETEVIEIPSKN
jgi:nicotinamidase-related amidase